MDQTSQTPPTDLAVIGIDIGKEVFHLIGLGRDGKVVLRRKIRRLALSDTFKTLPPCLVGMEACLSAHFVSRRRTATINQIRAFLIEQGIAVRAGANALRQSLFPILKNRADEISPRMADLIIGLYKDWLWLDERIESLTAEIDAIARSHASCQRLM